MALQWFIPMEAFVIFIFSEYFMTKLLTENREPNVIILSANTFSIKMLINEFTDIYIYCKFSCWVNALTWHKHFTKKLFRGGEGKGKQREKRGGKDNMG